ncbi:MAG: GH92 family glycosyl hydrolase, partial [Pyrinomonadaceae bacterium]
MAPDTKRAAFSFDTSQKSEVLLKVSISYVSIEGARKNLEAELPGWDFDKVRADAKAAWNKELSKIEVSGGTDEQTTNFYTALYHTMIHPNVFNDVDGRYLGHDRKVHQFERNADALVRNEGRFGPNNSRISRAPERSRSPSREEPAIADEGVRVPPEHYTVFSLWDTFRAAHPLYTIIDERRTVDFINTVIRQNEQGGRLPVWELWGEETDTMIGYHAVSVIADAMAKGIKGFDYEKAYKASKHSAELDHFGLGAYKKRGYISMEDENESVSKTLEYAYNDWCIAQMANVLLLRESKPSKNSPRAGYDQSTEIASFPIDAERQRYQQDFVQYMNRARYFENLFDPETGFMRPKKNGGFVSPFAPNEVTFNFTEGNSWVYSFFVPQDVTGLMKLMGGKEKFAAKLDDLFNTKDKLTGREQPDITGLIGQYAHGNEPSHHIAYLYNYAGQPWKTQTIVRRIMDDFYKNAPDGLIGNEDCGQMSAWYIMSAAGFYPVAPGDGIYAFGTPLFREMKFNLENGKAFVIKAPKASPARRYIASARLNGSRLRRAFVRHADIMQGGTLAFEIADRPQRSAFLEFPESSIKGGRPAVPVIEGGGRVFGDRTAVTMKTISPGGKILFGTDRVDPAWLPYTGPITINATTTVYAKTVNADGTESPIAEATFIKKPNDWTVKIASKYNRQYTGGGDEGLIDGIRGSLNFASGEWQGYQDQDFVATVDLQRPTEIRRVGGGFLQDARPWIWMPTKIEFETSVDGITFSRAANINTDVAPTDMKPQIRDYSASIVPTKARYVRIHAYNLGKIPAWHPGAGFEAFIFVDEIMIE